MTGMQTIVDQLTGCSRIPESAAPVLPPSLALPGDKPRKPDLRRNRKRPSKTGSKRDGRALILAALDRRIGRTVHEIAALAGVSKFCVYDHMPRLLEQRIVRAESGTGPRAPRRFWRVA